MSNNATGILRAIGVTAGSLVRAGYEVVRDAIVTVLAFIEHWLVDAKRAQYGFAVTRILIGLTGLGLLAVNFTTRLYTFGSGSAWNGEAAAPRSDFPDIWIFSWFNRVALNDWAFTLSYLALAALAVMIVLGWRKRFVLPLYFVSWVSFIEMNDLVGDQGDNMYRITLLMLMFTDCARRWSLDARRRNAQPRRKRRGLPYRLWNGDRIVPDWFTNPVHNLALVSLAAQVSFIYVSGALYKAGGASWQDGSAIYAPLETQRFGTFPELSDLVSAWPPILTALAWGSIILQLSFPFMLMRRPTRIIALVGILGFHIGIAVLMGLPWFSLAMIAVDAVFIRDQTWRGVAERVQRSWRDARARTGPTDDRARGDEDDLADDDLEEDDLEHDDEDSGTETPVTPKRAGAGAKGSSKRPSTIAKSGSRA